MIYFLMAVVLIFLWLLYEWFQHREPVCESTDVECNKLLKGEEIKICLITDLHNNRKNMKKTAERIREFRPDMIALAGDMTEKHTRENKNALQLIRELSTIAPLCYSYGNHEEHMRQDKAAFWQSYLSAVSEYARVLDNEKTVMQFEHIKESIGVSGLSLGEDFYKKGSLLQDDSLLPKLNGPDTEVHILLAHNPEYAFMYGKYQPDLVLSGHLHGGLLRLPGIGGVLAPRFAFPKEDAGAYSYPWGTLFISRGLGSHTIPLRFFNKVTINFINLCGTKEPQKQNGEQ